MARIVLIAGDYGSGRAFYKAGVFYLLNRKRRLIADVADVEANSTVVEKSLTRAIGAGVKSAINIAPLAMIVGVFAFPLVAVGTVGIAAAAVGGAIGLLGGGAKDKTVIQVRFSDGTGIVAVCDQEVLRQVERDHLAQNSFQLHAIPLLPIEVSPISPQLSLPPPDVRPPVVSDKPPPGSLASTAAHTAAKAAADVASAARDKAGSLLIRAGRRLTRDKSSNT